MLQISLKSSTRKCHQGWLLRWFGLVHYKSLNFTHVHLVDSPIVLAQRAKVRSRWVKQHTSMASAKIERCCQNGARNLLANHAPKKYLTSKKGGGQEFPDSLEGADSHEDILGQSELGSQESLEHTGKSRCIFKLVHKREAFVPEFIPQLQKNPTPRCVRLQKLG